VTLLDTGALYDPIGKLREVYPNVLHLTPRTHEATGETTGPDIDHRKMTEAELFSAFYGEVTGEPLTADQRKVFATVVERLRQTDREAHS
jgi:exonuclease SbcD